LFEFTKIGYALLHTHTHTHTYYICMYTRVQDVGEEKENRARGVE
jgi:hypothetical protein